jgi:hypothetical protein
MPRPFRTLRDRVLTMLWGQGRPCTRGELLHLGCLRHERGERSADLQTMLETLAEEGIIQQTIASRPLAGTRPGVAWELNENFVNSRKPIHVNKGHQSGNRS